MNIEDVIREALQEDIGNGDFTSLATIAAGSKGKANLLVKERGVLAGVEVAKKVFGYIDHGITMTEYISDGSIINPGDIVFEVEGPAISLLTAERTVLNFMQRMSGIATQTRMLCDLISDLPTKILDTRKTTPLLREFEKRAVKIGGGQNHRFGLFDMILIKDNHVDFAGGISNAIKSTHAYLRKNNLTLKVEIEVRNLVELREVLGIGGVDRIMLDNFSLADLREAVMLIDRRFETEASGGINVETVRDFALCGVDFVSIGSLTHHISSLDMSLKVKQ